MTTAEMTLAHMSPARLRQEGTICWMTITNRSIAVGTRRTGECMTMRASTRRLNPGGASSSGSSAMRDSSTFEMSRLMALTMVSE
ncbi:unannotated protein [freshwater metagenome]|uniref:Unannotated protein n=1 Tax=freshwater metagenome TaxID=449393 RepID=A0A6J6U1L6_9ZZZZ